MLHKLAAFFILPLMAACLFASGSETTKTKLQLNWKPEPEFGGFYCAQLTGSFAKNNLDVEIVPGGSGTPTVQMVGAGRVDFAIVSADELVLARSHGNNVVALFSAYQTNPQGIMTRKSRGFTKIDDIFKSPGILAIQKGLPYASYLEKKFGFDKLQIVPAPFGDLSKYRSDENYAMQCFVTSEPLAAMKTEFAPQTFLISDAGWNPYTAVVVTRNDYLKAHKDICDAMTKACREGWQAYLDDPKATNAMMNKLNPTMDLQTFAASADAQKPLVETKIAKSETLGSMTQARWKDLIDQMIDLKLVTPGNAPKPRDCFVPSNN